MTGIPDAALEADIAILGKKGRGKTYTAKGCVERLLDMGRRVIMLDPLSTWWGLKAGPNGHAIPVLGGPHGDLPLTDRDGAALGQHLATSTGSAELMAAYNEAVAKRLPADDRQLRAVLDAYQDSAEFRRKAERTQRDYRRLIRIIDAEFGDMPLEALNDKAVRGEFRRWRDDRAKRSLRQADYGWVVLSLVLAWALDGGMIDTNPCTHGGRLYAGTRAEKVWSNADEEAFLAGVPAHVRLAMMLALWTGQRQGDLLKLPWSAYDGTDIRLQQSKTGVRVTIPVGEPLKALLDATKRQSTIILTSTDKRPWTEDSFRVAWGRRAKAAGIEGLTFNDLRGTAVTRLFLAGCSEGEIATITGHTLRDVRSILDKHYFHRDSELARSAIRKLETRTKSQTGLQTGPGRTALDGAKIAKG